ncbi:proline utilization trans-activator [Podospora aff. communis PSN243]|uniref:Proline utilization trans-activator n=1 Tax=Podospora aff. communis PSN243 TaxID=3040156 RepID=A0AAV9GDB0_9PEZI|nr:proline utilization trans-activator [Podospora aff. communis PSN243]
MNPASPGLGRSYNHASIGSFRGSTAAGTFVRLNQLSTSARLLSTAVDPRCLSLHPLNSNPHLPRWKTCHFKSMAPSPTPSPASPASPEAAARRAVACLRCRHRRSYCSKDKPACTTCLKSASECIYEQGRRVPVLESSFRRLQAKVKAYEELLGPIQAAQVSAQTRPAVPIRTEDSDEEFEDGQDLLEPFTQLSIDKPSTKFKGPGNADYFLRNLSQLSDVPGDDGLDLNPDIYDPSALSSRRLLVRDLVIRLPPLDLARRLFAAQYTYLGTIFAFTDPASFNRELIAAYRGQPDISNKDACLGYAKVLATLALGQMYSVNQWIDYKGPPGFEYFTKALQLLPDAHEEGSVKCVETLALVGYFMQNMNRHDAAFLYIGMALRMAISLGLHQEVSASDDPAAIGLDEESREHRRRVWWSIYSLDRILSVKSGNPITIHDEDIGVRLPSRLPGETEYCPAVVLRHYTELSRILGEVTKCIYRRSPEPRPVGELMKSVQKINSDLSRWDRQLPAQLRFDPDKLSTTRESVSTFSHYYQCINMTARPLLFHVVRRRLQAIRAAPETKETTDWKDGLRQGTIAIIDRCISAAEGTIRMMAEARRRDLVATYGYMDGEHVFSAAIVLVMVCAAFPTRPSTTHAMNTGLDLLRDMAERGWNSHMKARYELLAHLRYVFLPGEPATPSAFSATASDPVFSPMSTTRSALESESLPAPTNASAEFEIPPHSITPEHIVGQDRARLFEGAAGEQLAEDPAPDGPQDLAPDEKDPIPDGPEIFTFDEIMFLDTQALSNDQVVDEMDYQAWEQGYGNLTVNAGLDLDHWY